MTLPFTFALTDFAFALTDFALDLTLAFAVLLFVAMGCSFLCWLEMDFRAVLADEVHAKTLSMNASTALSDTYLSTTASHCAFTASSSSGSMRPLSA